MGYGFKMHRAMLRCLDSDDAIDSMRVTNLWWLLVVEVSASNVASVSNSEVFFKIKLNVFWILSSCNFFFDSKNK